MEPDWTGVTTTGVSVPGTTSTGGAAPGVMVAALGPRGDTT